MLNPIGKQTAECPSNSGKAKPRSNAGAIFGFGIVECLGNDVSAESPVTDDIQKYNTTEGPNAASKIPRPNRARRRLSKSSAVDYACSMVIKPVIAGARITTHHRRGTYAP